MKYQIIYIEWCDAIDAGMGWQTIKSAKKWAKTDEWIIRQVGWIIKETKKYIVICAKYNPQGENYHDEIGYCTKIPKTWIIKRKIVKL
jgi:hypothetical protein